MKAKGMRLSGKVITFEDTAAQTSITNINSKLGTLEPKVSENLTTKAPTIPNARPNTVYKFGIINSLTVTAVPDSPLGITILFTADSSKPTISLPSTLEKINFVEFEANKKYAVAIENNIAVMGNVE